MATPSANKEKGTRRRSKREQQRKEQILQAAERLFRHYGFGKTTVADIAREANVGVGSVYLEFDSKEAIAAELSVQRYRCVLEAMRAAANAPGTSAERLIAMFDARLESLMRFATDGQHGQELIGSVCSATDKTKACFHADEEALLSDFLAAAQRTGELAIDNPSKTAHLLLQLYGAYGHAALKRGSAERMREEIASLHRLLLHGLLPR